MKKIFNILALLFISVLFFISCTSPLNDKYPIYGKKYNSGKVSGDEEPVPPPSDFEDDSVDVPSEQDPFNEENQFAPKPNDGGYNAAKFEDWRLVAGFDGRNVPEYKFSGTGWSLKNDSIKEYTYSGANSYAGGNSISSMTYYQYKNFNYLMERDAASSGYNTLPGHGDRLKRFYFYRFSGKGGGVASLDNCLMAVDSYSKLVFAYAKPLSYQTILGNKMPTSWGAFELYSSGPGGKKFKFYEYDPIGYVKENGEVVLYQWFKERQGSGNYDSYMAGGPDRENAKLEQNSPGKSPYLTEAVAGGSNLSEVVGTLTITAEYIKNMSVTDSWGDRGNGDSTDSPEFIFDMRASVYTGFDVPTRNSLANYKAENTSIMPSASYPINKGNSLKLSEAKNVDYKTTSITFGEYDSENDKYVGCKKEMYIELDLRLLEIDITSNDWISDYEKPLITLKYDRDSKSWVVSGDNGLYYNKNIYYDKDFNVRKSLTRTFVITLDADSSANPQKMEVAYKISWK